MIADTLFPSGEPELLSFIKRHAIGAKSVVVQAGHFLLYYDHTENLILPGIAQELNSPRLSMISKQIGYFPFATWALGLKILSETDAEKKQAFCVANDWQYLPDNVNRHTFYKNNPNLFAGYMEELSKHSSIDLLTPPKKPNAIKSDFFSEQTLRNQYERHIKKIRHEIQAQDELPSERYDLVQCIQDKSEIWCYKKRPNCVHEVAELLHQIQNQSAPDLYIGIYPKSCMGYISQGTELARELFNVKMKVCNIGLSAVSVCADNLFEGASVEYSIN